MRKGGAGEGGRGGRAEGFIIGQGGADTGVRFGMRHGRWLACHADLKTHVHTCLPTPACHADLKTHVHTCMPTPAFHADLPTLQAGVDTRRSRHTWRTPVSTPACPHLHAHTSCPHQELADEVAEPPAPKPARAKQQQAQGLAQQPQDQGRRRSKAGKGRRRSKAGKVGAQSSLTTRAGGGPKLERFGYSCTQQPQDQGQDGDGWVFKAGELAHAGVPSATGRRGKTTVPRHAPGTFPVQASYIVPAQHLHAVAWTTPARVHAQYANAAVNAAAKSAVKSAVNAALVRDRDHVRACDHDNDFRSLCSCKLLAV
eukprot:363884-Chlamydomonas_euryale.AAC.1